MAENKGNVLPQPETTPLVALMVGEGRLHDAAEGDEEAQHQEYGAVNNNGGAANSKVPQSAKKSPARKGWWKRKKKTNIDEYKTSLESRQKIHSGGLPRRNCCHGMFIFLSIASILTCLAMIISKVLPLF